MKLTTRGNYAIGAVLDMAMNLERTHISLKEIATRLDISENYLRQLCMQLSRRGIIKSIRGVSGGYYIAKSLADINLLDIVEAVEGDIYVVHCLDMEDEKICDRAIDCKAKPIWELLNKSIRNCLVELTIEKLLNEFMENQV